MVDDERPPADTGGPEPPSGEPRWTGERWSDAPQPDGPELPPTGPRLDRPAHDGDRTDLVGETGRRQWTRPWLWLALALVGFIVVGALSGDPEPDAPADVASIDGDEAPVVSPNPLPDGPTESVAPVAPATSPPVDDQPTEEHTPERLAAPDPFYPGIGATRGDWDAMHQEAPGYSEGTAYLPMVSGSQPKYAVACCEDRIWSYVLYLEPGTSRSEAEAAVRAEMPTDATPGQMQDRGGCHMQFWSSDRLTAEAEGMGVLATYFPPEEAENPDRRYVVVDLMLTRAEDVAEYEC